MSDVLATRVAQNPPREHSRVTPDPPVGSARLWRAAGGLAIAHVVMVFGAIGFERTPLLGDSPDKTAAALVRGPMVRTFAAGYVEALSFLVLLAGGLLLARLLRGRSEAAGWSASCIAGSLITYVAVTLAVGFPAGAAATYNGHHGAPLAVATTVNDVRNFAYFLSCAVFGMFAIAVASSVRLTGVLPRWVAYTGATVGILIILSVPAQPTGLMDLASMLLYAWFVA